MKGFLFLLFLGLNFIVAHETLCHEERIFKKIFKETKKHKKKERKQLYFLYKITNKNNLKQYFLLFFLNQTKNHLLNL